jgi:hypothetical protein
MSIEALRQKMHRPRPWPPAPRDLAIAAAAVAGVALTGIAALSPKSAPHGQPAVHTVVAGPTAAELDAREAAAGPTGAPLLWRIKGAHANIYLFGSVHVLRANMGWMDPRIYSAFDSAREVWFEVPDPYAKTHVKPVRKSAFAERPVLLDGLTDPEKAELAQVLRPFDVSPDDVVRLKPEAAAGMVDSVAMMAMGYAFDRGADMSLMRQAQTLKKPIHGFETMDQHIDFINDLSGLSQGDGTAALKHALATYAGQLSADGSDINTLAACWRTGNEACITREVSTMRRASPRGYEILLRRRNANWVPRIEAMAQGPDNIFITVGAAHMVGPDGLVAQLRASGLIVDRIDP